MVSIISVDNDLLRLNLDINNLIVVLFIIYFDVYNELNILIVNF